VIQSLSYQSYLEHELTNVIIDVRSPSEYAHAHIPGAISFPLLNDEERAIVGTAYKKEGHKQAVIRGFELVGGKFAQYLKDFDALNLKGEIIVHCWRGGLRSNIMSWLLEKGGYKTQVLKGGYKLYRNWVLQQLNNKPKLIVLGGMTGSNKTGILQQLPKYGEAIIDLEALANHRGSAFGGLGFGDQPSQEMFENRLAVECFKNRFATRVWIENESRLVGNCVVPQAMYEEMRTALNIELKVDFDTRLKNILKVYGSFDRKLLVEKTMQIEKRLGNQNMRNAITALLENDHHTWASILLTHYDGNYNHSKKKYKNTVIPIEYTDDVSCIQAMMKAVSNENL
jgi:tRNA 2-selenouridine synthase